MKSQLEGLLGRRDGITIETSPDQSDEVQYSCERDLAIRTLDREYSQLREVNSALRRIDDGDFGTCIHCEGVIGAKRLAAVPWASRCLACQRAADHHHGTAAGEAALFSGGE